MSIIVPAPSISEVAQQRASLARSSHRIRTALEMPCPEHGAAAGQPCWGSPASRVVGFCAAHFEQAAMVAATTALAPVALNAAVDPDAPNSTRHNPSNIARVRHQGRR